MNEEEKKAIEYTENCLMKITLGIDCEFDVNILDTLLNIIKKLQKENEELKNQEATARRINELLVQRYSNSIPVQKVKDNIKKLEIKKEKARGERDILERFAIEKSINSLQELLYGRNK